MKRGLRLFALVLASCAAASPGRAVETLDDRSAPTGGAKIDLRRAWLEKIEADRRNHEAFVARARQRLEARAEGYLDDPTLQQNDIVVTRGGFLVFRGSSGDFRHRPSDFRYLSEAEGERRFRLGKVRVAD